MPPLNVGLQVSIGTRHLVIQYLHLSPQLYIHTHTHTQCYYLITKFYCALEVLNVILHMEALVPGIKSDAILMPTITSATVLKP